MPEEYRQHHGVIGGRRRVFHRRRSLRTGVGVECQQPVTTAIAISAPIPRPIVISFIDNTPIVPFAMVADNHHRRPAFPVAPVAPPQ